MSQNPQPRDVYNFFGDGAQLNHGDGTQLNQVAEKPELERLCSTLESLVNELRTAHPAKAVEAAVHLRDLVDAVKEPAPREDRQKRLSLSGKGLIDAAKFANKLATPMAATVKTVLQLYGVVL